MNASHVLMHKNRELGKLVVDTADDKIVDFTAGSDVCFLPPRTQRGLDNLKCWWADRAIPNTRKSLHSYLADKGVESTGKYLLDNLGLSLNDCWWIRPEHAALSWEDVNFFNNPFFSPAAYSVRHHSENPDSYSFSPDSSTGGDLPKWWIVENGERWLLKGNPEGGVQQSHNEILASMVHRSQGFQNHVEYEICKLPNGLTGYRCKAFTSEKDEFISAGERVGYAGCKDNAPLRRDFLEACKKGRLSEKTVSDFPDYQVFTDFLIFNTDRHLNNFGIIRDSDTLEFKRMAPVFDSGNSMMFRQPWDASISNALNEKLRGFSRTNRGLLSNITNRELLDNKKLPSRKEVFGLYASAPHVKEGASKLAALFQMKKDFIGQFQKGRSYFDLCRAFCPSPGRIER